MNKNLIVLTVFFFICVTKNAFSQIRYNQILSERDSQGIFSTSLVVPLILIGTGTAIMLTDDKTHWDEYIRESVQGNRKLSLDDYLIYVPLATDIGLTMGGVLSKHNVTDKALLYLLASSVNALLVYPAKYLIGRERPDNSNLTSFPSGHSSNAFVGASYFWNEYRDRHPLLASTAFANALITGFLRVYNDKHWASDVICGAGAGILSMHIANWIYPRIKKIIPSRKNIVLKPVSSTNGIGLVIHF